MSNKIPANILALYTGQRCIITCKQGSAPIGPGSAVIVDTVSPSTAYFMESGNHEVTIYLRRISSITEGEAADLHEIRFGTREVKHWHSAIHWWHDFSCDELYVRQTMIGNPYVWAYLLEKGFDLFGLIDKGLAKEIPSPE